MGNVTSNVAAKFAFFPPEPPTYDVLEEEGGMLVVPGVTADKNMEVHCLDTKAGNKVVAMFWKHPFASYDYSGYGASSGKPSELNTYYDIEAVYNCLKDEYGVNQEQLILYGQSVGSGPTLHLAARLSNLRGVVLHSAILSGIRVLCSVKMTLWFDIFKNIDKIRHVNCPVLVIHGTSDEIVDWSHGRRLWELAKEKYDPLWVKGGGHCNLETYPEYIKHLRKYVHAMEKIAMTRPSRQSIGEPEMESKQSTSRCLRFGLKSRSDS
ncbi:Alpha/beta hydrolase domain-containing protein 17B [Linum perenne]